MKENKTLQTILLILKLLIALILVLSTVYYAFLLISAYIETVNTVPPEEGIYLEPFPIALTVTLVFSLITNAVSAFLSLIGLVVSTLFHSSPKRKKNIISFAVLLILPVLLQLLVLLIGILY